MKRPAAAVEQVAKKPATAAGSEARTDAGAAKKPASAAGSKADKPAPKQPGLKDYGPSPQELLAQWSPSERAQIKRTIKMIGILTVCSACTGTNMGSFAFAALLVSIGAGCMQELFTCEKDPRFFLIF